jgi:hypothetical protein
MGIHTMITELLVKLYKQRLSKILLVVAEVFVFIAACSVAIAVFKLHPLPLTAFLMIGQPLFIIGMALYLLVSIVQFLARRGTARMKFAPGEVIFRQGDKGEFVYTIIEGTVDITVENPDGDEKVLARLEQGAYFGEMALISNEPRMATATAVNAVIVMTISRRDFKNLHAYLPALKENIEKVIQSRSLQKGQAR